MVSSEHKTTDPDVTPVRRRYGIGALIAVAVTSAVLAAGAVLGIAHFSASRGTPSAPTTPTSYQCPMHPTIVQNHPGDCPICGMKLVPMAKAAAHATKQPAAATTSGHNSKRRILYYRSPMNPTQTSPTPRKDEMGMDYVPVYADEASGTASSVPGFATVEVDPERQQLIGLKTTLVEHGTISGAWRTVGRVAIDETRVAHINIKVAGFVDHVFVDFVGKHVRRGDRLFSIYSPELLAAQHEYLLALRTRDALTKAGGDVGGDGKMLVEAARRKLELWDVPPIEIDRIAHTGQASKTLVLTSPVTGVVTKKDVVEGMKLDAGAMPYEIVDLSTVWVLADAYESDLRFVKLGMAATLTLDAFPGRELKGKVTFIDPVLDPRTRTAKVRLTFPNRGYELRPEMFGEVVLHGPPHDGLLVPADAVIHAGTQDIVFLSLPDGKLQPRRVELGPTDGQRVEIISGLTADDRVVVRANFLVDSESRLRASLAQMAPQAAHGAPAKTEGPDSARVLPTPKPHHHATQSAP